MYEPLCIPISNRIFIVFILSDNCVNMDMVEFGRIVDYDAESDYGINSTFPSEPAYHLRHLIEFRIKLLLRADVVIEASETKLVDTACKIGKGLKLSGYVKKNDKLPLTCESEEFVSPRFRGRVTVKLTNYSMKPVKLSSGMCVGYLILSPFTLG